MHHLMKKGRAVCELPTGHEAKLEEVLSHCIFIPLDSVRSLG